MHRHARLGAALLILVLLFLSVSCSDDDKSIAPAVDDELTLVARVGEAYFADYTTPDGQAVDIDAAEVSALLNDSSSTNDPYILDWRSEALFQRGHLANAHRVDLADFDRVLRSVPADRTVLNVCATGLEASQVTAFMNMLGVPAQTLRFGMCGWTSERSVQLGRWDEAIAGDYSSWLVDTPTSPTAMHPLPALQTGRATGREILRERARTYLAKGTKKLTIAEFVRDLAIDPQGETYFLVQCASESEYAAGHLPNAVRFDSREDFRIDRRLTYLPTDRKIVVSCSTGQRAAQVVAYLNALGYDASVLLYGSNGVCYSNDAACPIRYTAPQVDRPVVRLHDPDIRTPDPLNPVR